MIKFIIFQSPVGCNEQFLRRLGDETLQHQVRPQMLDIVYHEADIFLHIKQMKIFRMLPVLQSHAGTPYQLQLVHLQGSEWQAGQYTGLCHDAFVRLARQSEYDMPTGQDSA